MATDCDVSRLGASVTGVLLLGEDDGEVCVEDTSWVELSVLEQPNKLSAANRGQHMAMSLTAVFRGVIFISIVVSQPNGRVKAELWHAALLMQFEMFFRMIAKLYAVDDHTI